MACELDKETAETACMLAIKPSIFNCKGTGFFFQRNRTHIEEIILANIQKSIKAVEYISKVYHCFFPHFYFFIQIRIINTKYKSKWEKLTGVASRSHHWRALLRWSQAIFEEVEGLA
ncbi:hypothetical protein V6Z12_A09G168300 [Gossypium hirsutum]